jgi:glycosyltransferase involved in cell wall biosynthesis
VESWHRAGGVLAVLARLAALGRVDIVHAHMTHAELGATLAGPLTGAHLVVSRHFPGHRGATRTGGVAARAIRRAVELQLASSAHVAARVDGSSRVVLPGVPAFTGPAPVARERVVLVLQRLEPEKDNATALRAWACSGLGDHGWKLHLAGEGRERASLGQLASALGVAESCRFLGAVDEVEPLLATASMLLATGPDEAFGLSVVEAMAAGVPVVAARAGGHLENVGLCPGAVLFAPGDARDAGRGLRELADDEPRRRHYGRELQALQREHFSADRQVLETLALYRSLTAG